jgi:hypothetical protein
LLWSRNPSFLGALSSFPSLLPPLLLQVDQNFVKTLFRALGLVREYKNKGQTKRVGKGEQEGRRKRPGGETKRRGGEKGEVQGRSREEEERRGGTRKK